MAEKAARRAEVDNKLNDLYEGQQELYEDVGQLKAGLSKLKKKVGYVTKGEYIVVEGSKRVEALFEELCQVSLGLLRFRKIFHCDSGSVAGVVPAYPTFRICQAAIFLTTLVNDR